MILSAYDDYIPINNSMAIQHFLMVITLRTTHGLYRIHTSDSTRKRQNNGVGIYEFIMGIRGNPKDVDFFVKQGESRRAVSSTTLRLIC